ncbi:Biotin carboxyl carrier protein of acetyl-CoA carboxylase [Camellia lanceoleosa]|uniref:Biotin carboxyl carrier protein of acetyl-CoA carboxylase n=1 Tax=Camellia lanceoleosa TaxID=1840588 RepID=A0ACC0IY73_9ERIC|nr:Biotin carboxyl carrier protein of acetyl-CoA carboxylase [Camellia lanceoleosa]
MDSAAVLRSFNYSVGTVSLVRSVLERPCMVAVHNATWPTLSRSHIQGLTFGGSIPIRQEGMVVACIKAFETVVAAKSDVPSDSQPQRPLEKNGLRRATFPNGFEELVLEVCDETEIAELKLKVGDFEMHLKRNIGAAHAPLPVVSPTTPPPIPSKPMIESAAASPPTPPPKSSTEKISPFTNVSVEKSTKLAALEASGASGYVLMSSPTVGSFRRGRTLKGKKQPPICKEGDVIKEGQVIGFVDQFGTELPVKSDVAGEVLKLLFNDGEAVGYGDPLIAVLPSFHGIE